MRRWSALVAVFCLSLPLFSSCCPNACLFADPCATVCGQIADVAAAPEPRIKIFVTNDVHGHAVEEKDEGRIGYAKFRAYVKKAETDGYKTIVLDAGDAFSGSAFAQFDSGRSIAKALSMLGYAAVCPGNHAFDFNLAEHDFLYYFDTLLPAVGMDNPAFLGAVACNLAYRGGPLPHFSTGPVVVYDDSNRYPDGLRIAVAGVLTPYTSSQANKKGVAGFDFGLVEENGVVSHAATKRNVLAKLAQSVAEYDRPNDVVVVLSHLGYDDTEDYAHGQICGYDAAMIPQVDIVCDSHSHNVLGPEKVGDVLYANAGRYLEQFLEITVDMVDGKAEKRLEMRTCGELADSVSDPAVTAYFDAVAEKMGFNQTLFHNNGAVDLSDADIKSMSKPLGRLICRSMLEASGSDLALYNSGGLRGGFPHGEVTVRDLYNVTPFLNDLVTYELTGRQIAAMVADFAPLGAKGFPQWYGMTVYAWEGEANKLQPVGILDASGRLLDPNALYTVAFNGFLASGGDNFKFEYMREGENFGDCTGAISENLRSHDVLDLDSVGENHSLLLFPDEKTARAEWEKATTDAAETGKAA